MIYIFNCTFKLIFSHIGVIVIFYKKAIKYQEKYKKPGMQIHNNIQTNGILLDDEWCQFFREIIF
jgi:sulfatase maturation enzyme AslB (radical SAM superfamily)